MKAPRRERNALADEHVNEVTPPRHGRGDGSGRDQRQVDDEALLGVATGEGRLLLTNDTDLLRIHSRWLSDRRDHARIVFWRQDLAIGPAVRRILQYALQTSPSEAANGALDCVW